MNNLLKCKICSYESKQLFQHIKSVHNVSTDEYRKTYGNDVIMQINFDKRTPQYFPNQHNSTYVKKGYCKIFNSLNKIKRLYKLKYVISILNDKNSEYFYRNYFGRSKNRSMMKKNLKLYKSIYFYSNILEKTFKHQQSYKGNYNFTNRLKFIVEKNTSINNLLCHCKKTYTWNLYCKECPIDRAKVLGTKKSSKSILKCRLSTLNYLKKTKGQITPRYNIHSIPIIEQYANENGYNFQHAENGGEFYIKELGYWVDGYDKEKNVVIEVDEKYHRKKKQLEKDVTRQNEIKKFLNCKFVRIKYDGKK